MATAKKPLKARAPARKAPARKAPTTSKAAVKPPPAPPKPLAAAHEPAAAKPEKTRKPKLVRDSFTIPKLEYAVLEDLKQRAAQAGSPAKKSELLRAGVKVLAGMGDAAFLPRSPRSLRIKTGRPAKT